MLFYRDMSGESLHHRGYRAAMHRASLNEAAAAGILQLAGWPAVAEQNPGKPSTMQLSQAFMHDSHRLDTRRSEAHDRPHNSACSWMM